MASAMPDSANCASHLSHGQQGQHRDEETAQLLPSLAHRGQLVVLNEGSVTRDYLAYERNYLAWIKLVVSLLVISGGLVIRLNVHEDSEHPSKPKAPLEDRIALPMGIIFFVVSVLSLIAATMSFFSVQTEMLKGLGHVSSGRFTQVVSLLATATIAVACILLMISTA